MGAWRLALRMNRCIEYRDPRGSLEKVASSTLVRRLGFLLLRVRSCLQMSMPFAEMMMAWVVFQKGSGR